MINEKVRVLSGIRASNSSLHIGNLIGSLDAMIKLQDDPRYEPYYMVADLHGITTNFDPEKLRKNRMEVAMDYLAVGIDPTRSALFLQSEVTEHAEFAYYVSSVTLANKIQDLPSLKEKIKNGNKYTMALLSYPVLMAADILLYKARLVPLGKDQMPHIEVARGIARTLNKEYGLDFPIPERSYVYGENFVVPSLSKNGGKMSKDSPDGAIFLNDSLENIYKKISKISTGSGFGKTIPEDGGVATLLFFVEYFIGIERRKELERQYLLAENESSGIKFGVLKKEISEAIFKRLEPIQQKRKYFVENPDVVRKILDEGATKARLVAQDTVREVKLAMGLS